MIPAQVAGVRSVIIVADTSSKELASKAGLPVAEFTSTVARFNGFARAGVDEEYHRGESAYDKYYRRRPDQQAQPQPG